MDGEAACTKCELIIVYESSSTPESEHILILRTSAPVESIVQRLDTATRHSRARPWGMPRRPAPFLLLIGSFFRRQVGKGLTSGFGCV